jgi:radical SAM protein
MLVFYETTRACDLVCAHCRACAQPAHHPEELTPGQSLALLDELCRFPVPPTVVLTGGDPMKRHDIFDIVRHGVSRGLSMSMTPSATALVTKTAIARLADEGLARLAVSLDGSTAMSHDGLRGVHGSFARTLQILSDARDCGLPLQVNTTVHRGNVDELPALAELLEDRGIVLWSVFFLVPVGRGAADRCIEPERYEEVFAVLAGQSLRRGYVIKTTAAPHYRRFLMRARKAAHHELEEHRPAEVPRPEGMLGTNDGKGVLFVGHTGVIHPSGFLPIDCSRFPEASVVDVYQNHELFRSLRYSDGFSGKCGVCEYRTICGGSRARAFASTGDALASDPDCIYVPVLWKHGGVASADNAAPR